MTSCEIIKSERGRDLLVLDGFKFSFHKYLSGDNVKRWTCASRKEKCKAFIRTEGEDNIITATSLCHNHSKISEKLFNRQKISNSLKRKAVVDISERPAKLINLQLNREDCDTVTVEDIVRIRKNIYHARRSVQPKIPRKLEDIQDENFMLKNDRINNIVMFSSATNLKSLTEMEELYVDGTFEYCLKLSYHLFSVHGLKDGIYIPLVFFLLPNKLSKTYKLAFDYLQEACVSLGLQLKPRVITADLEMAVQEAVNQVFSETKFRECPFHLAQSWYRNIQSLGLSSEDDRSNEEVCRYLTYIGILNLNIQSANYLNINFYNFLFFVFNSLSSL